MGGRGARTLLQLGDGGAAHVRRKLRLWRGRLVDHFAERGEPFLKDGKLALRGCLVFDFDPEILGGVLRAGVAEIESTTTSIRRELAEPPGSGLPASATATTPPIRT